MIKKKKKKTRGERENNTFDHSTGIPPGREIQTPEKGKEKYGLAPGLGKGSLFPKGGREGV